jgi:hypothetical protein
MANKTADRIAEIRARADAATPGHWGVHYDGNGTYTIEAQPRLLPGVGNVREGVVATLHGEHDDAQPYRDSGFMARAREDVPFLLERVAKLEGLVKELTDPDACWFDHQGHCQAHGWPYTEPSCPDGRAQTLFPELKES